MVRNEADRTRSPYFASAVAAGIMIVLFSMVTGCLHVQTNARGIQPGARPMQKDAYTELGPGTGMSSGFRLLWFIPVTPCPCANKAVNNAIYSQGGDNLIEVKYWHERQYWLVGTVDIIHVEGTVIRYTSEETGEE